MRSYVDPFSPPRGGRPQYPRADWMMPLIPKLSLLRGENAQYEAPMEHPLDPEDCSNMQEVRAGVDAVDAALIALIARRFGYMRAAARIKPVRGHVRDE